MKAISLHMPWALWVTIKGKPIETRKHDRFKSLKGERIAIHAAQALDETAFFSDLFKQKLTEDDAGDVQAGNQIYWANALCGMILCTAFVKDARWANDLNKEEYEDWSHKALIDVAGKFCLFLEDVKPLKKQIPYAGQQGIFNVPDALIEEVDYE